MQFYLPLFPPVFLCLACGPSLEDHIENLSGSPEDQLNAQHELLLAKEQAVEPLLKALEDPRYAAGRLRGRLKTLDVARI